MSKTLDEARNSNVDEEGYTDPFVGRALDRLEKLEKAIEIHEKALRRIGADCSRDRMLWDALKED